MASNSIHPRASTLTLTLIECLVDMVRVKGDALPAEWFKVCLMVRQEAADLTPVSPMAKVLWKLLEEHMG